MSQFEKDEIRQRLIEAAREEFQKNGFEKASIRTITAKAKTSKSNLYNYFKDKNHLFHSVLEPTVIKIRKGLESAKQYNTPKNTDEYTQESQSNVMGTIVKFVAENLTDVKLLLFKAQGSMIENFKYEVLEVFTDNMCNWVKSFKSGDKISRLFVRSICSYYLSVIEQMILYGRWEELPRLQHEISSFVYNGWRGVLK